MKLFFVFLLLLVNTIAYAGIKGDGSEITGLTKAQVGLNTTDDLPQGSTNKYANVTKEDNGQSAFGWDNHANAGYATQSNLTTHTENTSNPHSVTKAQVGLTNVTDVQAQPADADLDTVSAPGNYKVIYSNATGNWIPFALGDSGTYLKSNGASSAPTFDTPAGTAQTPWTSDIDGGGKNLTNVTSIAVDGDGVSVIQMFNAEHTFSNNVTSGAQTSNITQYYPTSSGTFALRQTDGEYTTAQVAEDTNKYFTNTRARQAAGFKEVIDSSIANYVFYPIFITGNATLTYLRLITRETGTNLNVTFYKGGTAIDLGTTNDVALFTVNSWTNGTDCSYAEVDSFNNDTIEEDVPIIVRYNSGTNTTFSLYGKFAVD